LFWIIFGTGLRLTVERKKNVALLRVYRLMTTKPEGVYGGGVDRKAKKSKRVV